MSQRPLSISRSTIKRHGDGNRITALVDGMPIWFESDTLPLSGVGEAIASAMFVPGLHQDRQLVLEEPVSPLWKQNVPRIAAIMAGWWGIPQHAPIAPLRTQDLQAKASGSMLCFSGGVDAFHTLLRGDEKIRHLITAHGYDIGVGNLAHWKRLDHAVRRTAADIGLPLTVIRTNLRLHPICEATTWLNLYGGGLAALAHLMRDHGDRLMISSSCTPKRDFPCGIHWDMDHFWSSEAVTLRHFGEQCDRGQKLRAIANEPLARRNLHVCTKRSDNPSGNCSQCEKCLRTMVLLEQCDALPHFPVFTLRKTLVELIDDLPGLAPSTKGYWLDIIADGLRPDLKAAVNRLLIRTAAPPNRRSWLSRGLRALKKSIRGTRVH